MKVLVAVPVFNEEKYAASVMREIRKYARAAAASEGIAEVRVLVVDDGSTDNTPCVLRELSSRGHIELITHPENRGYGQSLIDAFAYGAARGFDWVITMDCDEQHEPCRIPLFVRECAKDDADIISGSRYLRTGTTHAAGGAENGEGEPPEDRRNINRRITQLLNSTLKLNVEHLPDTDATGLTDSFCGFKAHRVAAMQRMTLNIPGYAFPMQFWVQAAALGLRIREIPVKLIYKDATRHFGGMLDDPAVRLRHYLEVLGAEMRAIREAAACSTTRCCQDSPCAMALE